MVTFLPNYLKQYLHNWKILLIVTLFLGAFLRFCGLGNTSFVADEFLDMNSSYGYFKTGEWQAWDFNMNQLATENIHLARDERAAAYKWQVAGLFHFLPPTEEVARGISALWGLISIILVYFVATYFTGRKMIGLITAFLFAVSISALESNRYLRMYSMFAPVFLAFSWMSFRFLEEPYDGKVRWLKTLWNRFGFNFLYLLPAVLLGLLSLHLHLLTLNIIAIVFIYCLARCFPYIKEKKYWNKYSVLLITFILGLFGAKLFLPEGFQLLTSALNFPDNHSGYLRLVLEDYAHPLLAIILILLGAWYLIRHRPATEKGWWVTLSFFVPLLLAVFVWDRNVGAQYIFFAEPFKMILAAAGILAAVEFLSSHFKACGPKAFFAPLILLLLLVPNYGYFFQENNTYHQTASGDQPNYRKVFGYFLKQHNPEDILITRAMRNYYWAGAHVRFEEFGGEIEKNKLTLERLQHIFVNYPSGWIIFSDNDEDFITRDALAYIEKNLEKVSNDQVRGKISVYRWKMVE